MNRVTLINILGVHKVNINILIEKISKYNV